MPANETSGAKICEKPPQGSRGLVFQAIILMAIWLILSGHYDFIHIGYGVGCVAFVVWFNSRMRCIALAGEEACGETKIRLFALALYLPWLVWQILLAAAHVAKVVLKPQMPINPALIRFETKFPNVIAKVIMANSITLTPGTITVNLIGDEFLVHSLTGETTEGLVCGDMQQKVAKLYRPEGLGAEEVCFNVETIQSGRGV